MIVKYVPEWFPGARFQREAREWKTYAMKMLHEPFDIVKRQFVSQIDLLLGRVFNGLARRQAMGVAPESVATTLLETMVKDSRDDGYMESVVSGALASMYVGKLLQIMQSMVCIYTILAAGADTVSIDDLVFY